ncbi:MAG: cytochrome C oxidase subunit IV family protein [Pseudomonadota bacterium]
MSADAGTQEHHSLAIYYKVWALLFVLSAFSYMVDYIEVQGFWRWFWVLTFMTLKAGFIIAIFMHAFWERLALIWTILGPPILLLFLILFMAFESNYTESTRVERLGHEANQEPVSMEVIRASH